MLRATDRAASCMRACTPRAPSLRMEDLTTSDNGQASRQQGLTTLGNITTHNSKRFAAGCAAPFYVSSNRRAGGSPSNKMLFSGHHHIFIVLYG